ncbi:MAG TPA: glycosyltransferase family 39 protein [Solirubrobacteraceae bacterium]|nr:glycosyltransferase family 39 protein [Solirubrobacteraceae bacterium]
MSAVAAPLERLRPPIARFWALPVELRVALGVAFLAGFSVALRTQAIHARYWIDEGLSVGIGSQPLLDIPGVLRQDGSPPLYYMLLGVWMRIFDHGEADTHALSVAIATLIVPTAFVAGRALFGPRAGWIAALLAALNPFLTYYAQEARMYALVVLLSLIMITAFVLGFVHRRRAWLPVFALSLALLLYTHNYGLYLGVGTAAAVLVLMRGDPGRRALLRDAALAYGAVALAYLPWVPTLLFQVRHTGAPWSNPPSPSTALAGLTALLSGASAATAFALAGGSGLASLLVGPRLRGPKARGALALLTMLAVGFMVAWLVSQISPAWALRYLSVFLAPLLLLGAAGLARAGTLGLVVLVGLVILWFNPRTGALNSKSNAHTAAVLVRDRLEPGDLVVATHPEQGPVMHVYLPPGLRWANSMGPVADPRVMDWRDVRERLLAAKPTPTEDALVRTLRSGQRLLLVAPIIRSGGWRAPWTSLVRRRSAQWQRVLDRDERLSRVLAAPHLNGRRPKGVRLVLYERL